MITLAKESHFTTNVTHYLTADIKPEHKPECLDVTKKAIAARARYESVSKVTGVPWFVIACLHRREADESWLKCLHNGEAIIGTGKKTTLVPAGRGPFATWEEAAIDAIKSGWHTYGWDLGGILEFCERYNGLGYRNHGYMSPYIWDYTTLYDHGLFNKDGHFDPNLIERRPGVAAMLKCLEELGEIKLI